MRRKIKCMKCGYWNKPEAPYCGLCYEPLNKRTAEKAGRAPAPSGKPAPEPRPGLPQVAAAAVLLALTVGLAVHFMGPRAPDSVRSQPRLNRFGASTDAADKLLTDYLAAKETLLKEIAAAPPAPEAFSITGDYTQKLFAIEDAYSKGIAALALPGAGDVDPKRDQFYLEWLEIHRYRESRAMEDFDARYRQQLKRAGLAD
ncbi:MAG: hypothetical protein M0025_09000 [Elusimicrobia bacterium]|nr:hypothetical protein [Elusimicrobiota bacterium]